MTEAGHFAQTGPVRVLELVLQARLVPVNFAPAGRSFGNCARAAFLPVHFGGRGGVGAFAWALEMLGYLPQSVPGHFVQLVLGHFAQPAPAHLERTVPARPLPAHLSQTPTLGTA